MDEKHEPQPPKPRRHALLWQAYQRWDELVQMRKKHNQKLAFIAAGRSNLDAAFEQDIVDSLDPLIPLAVKEMASYGKTVGPAWDWLTGIKGIGDSLAAQLLAQIDDITLFATVSKLWRFAGYAVFDGLAEKSTEREKRHYNGRLKSTVWLIVEQFIRQQTPHFVDLYYAEKERLRDLHPERELSPEEIKASGRRYRKAYTKIHIDKMARRKVGKELLKQLWIVWRSDALPPAQPTELALESVVA